MASGRFVVAVAVVAVVVAALSVAPSCVRAQSPPVWPDVFSSTLAKINPNNDNIVWAKLYYLWSLPSFAPPGGLARFDFFSSYKNLSLGVGLQCSIYFKDFKIYFYDPATHACTDDHPTLKIASISPTWLVNATFVDTVRLRGLDALHWNLPTDLGDIDYYERVTAAGVRVPMRSTNQLNDPGATDYLDFSTLPLAPEPFELPCTRMTTTVSCPPDDDDAHSTLLALLAAAGARDAQRSADSGRRRRRRAH